MSVKLPVAVPLTDTRSSWPVETDNVPAPGGGADEVPAAGVGFVAAAELGAPGDRKATGAVVPLRVYVGGASPCPPLPPSRLIPLLPEGPPRAGAGFLVLTGVDPPAGPAAGWP